MLRNYLLVTWRNLVRNKTFSFINISGLAIGMAAAALILLWMQLEISYNNFHEKKDRIYQAWNSRNFGGEIGKWNNTPKPMAAAIQQDYPEVEKTTRYGFLPPYKIDFGKNKFYGRGKAVDSTFLQIFTFPVVDGDARTPLNDPSGIVLTASFAKSIFGTQNPIGQTLTLDNSVQVKVTAVIADVPANSDLEFKFLLPWAHLRSQQFEENDWGNNSTATYVLLKEGASLQSITPKIKNLRAKYDKSDGNIETFLYPLSRWHLYSNFNNGMEEGGRIVMVRLFAIITAFILLIACINFMNLSTARSEKRAKEVGIRKVVGAQKKSLVVQFLGESVVLAAIAGGFALLILAFSLPAFSKLVGKPVDIDFSEPSLWLAGIAFVLLTGVLAGSYPSLYLSSFRPVSVLKGLPKAVHTLVAPRKILVIMQFTFAILLITGTIVVRQQIQKAQNRQSGYQKNNLVYHFTEGDSEKNYPMIKQELLSAGTIVSASRTSAPITEMWSNTWGIEWAGKDKNDKTVINRYCADDAVVKTLGLQLVAGRDLDLKQYLTDSTACLLNESAVKHMGFKDALGQTVKDNGIDWHVVGVVKDFIIGSPYQAMEPMFIAGAKGWFNVIHFKLNDQRSVTENMASLKAVINKYNPAYEANLRFVDEEYAKKFEDEKRTSTMASLFTLLTIIISCLGLFGLSSYMAENRIKEIGVRKVLGASVVNITAMLSRDFIKLVLVAVVIATPLAWYFMQQWLQQFSYRVTLQWWVFAIAGLAAVLIAGMTISYQVIRAALRNPVTSLRAD